MSRALLCGRAVRLDKRPCQVVTSFAFAVLRWSCLPDHVHCIVPKPWIGVFTQRACVVTCGACLADVLGRVDRHRHPNSIIITRISKPTNHQYAGSTFVLRHICLSPTNERHSALHNTHSRYVPGSASAATTCQADPENNHAAFQCINGAKIDNVTFAA